MKAGRCSRVESEKFNVGSEHLQYCLYLKAYPSGNVANETGYVSLFLAPTPSKHDGQMKWPFSQSFSLSIVDQQPQGKDWKIDYSPPYGSFFDSPTSNGWGDQKFISHEKLSNHCYIKNDSVVVKVMVTI